MNKPTPDKSGGADVPRRNVLAAGISLIASRAPVEGQAVSDAPASRTEELQYMGVMELAEKLRKRELSPIRTTVLLTFAV